MKVDGRNYTNSIRKCIEISITKKPKTQYKIDYCEIPNTMFNLKYCQTKSNKLMFNVYKGNKLITQKQNVLSILKNKYNLIFISYNFHHTVEFIMEIYRK